LLLQSSPLYFSIYIYIYIISTFLLLSIRGTLKMEAAHSSEMLVTIH
jgi:hypothetical protein